MAICEGITVLDLGRGFATSLATMILADNGAEVVKIEPPGGDAQRSAPAWLMWNRGKKSVVLDLESAEGRAQAFRLAGSADVLLEDFVTGAAGEMGLGYEALKDVNPRLLYCSVTALGPVGDYRDLPAYEGLVEARAGGYLGLAASMHRDAPTYRVRPEAGYATANLLVQAIMGGLRVRHRTGKGQRIQTSLYQGMTCYEAGSYEADQKRLGMVPSDGQAPSYPGLHLLLNYMVARCKDGQWMQLTNNTSRLFPKWIEAIGLGGIFQDDKFKGAPFSFQDDSHRVELRRMLLAKMGEKTIDEWMDIFMEKGLAGDRFLTTQQFMDHPQTIHNQGVVEIDDPVVGATKQIGTLIRFSKTPSTIATPAPRVGEHTDEVLADEVLAAVREPAVAPRSSNDVGAVPKHPFDGFLVLDFAGWLAAPFGTSLIADLGARVIKVESLAGDEFRSRGQGRGRTFQGKESLCIDLKNPEGRKVIHKLIAKADAIMHNMRGDAANRLGIDFETVVKINPEIVYLYAGSYGSTGPGAGRAAFHPTAGAMTGGALWQLGRGNEPPPCDEPLDIDEIDRWSMALIRANEGSPDVTAALAVGTAMAMALYHKERTGQGQYLETSMLISNGYISSDDFVRYEGKPPRQEPDRYLRGTHALRRLYRTADGWVFLECQTQREWESLCRAIGRPELADDARFADHASRQIYDGHLVAALGEALSRRASRQWEADLCSAGAPCVIADHKSPGEFFLTDPNLQENELIVKTHHPVTGPFYRQGPPSFFSMTPTRAESAHLLGEDTESILREVGLNDDQIERLKRDAVVKSPADAVVAQPG